MVVTYALGNAITGIQSIAAGWSHSLALKSDGTLLAWGANGQGQLGDGTFTNRVNPVVVTDALGYAITGIQSVAAGVDHSLALKNDGTLLAWGWNQYGELGNGTTINRSNPVVVVDALGNAIGGIQSIAAGYYSLVLKSDGTLLAWGWNRYGQLGDGTSIDRTNPVVVVDALNAIGGIQSIATGILHSLALKTDGTLLAWGGNGAGQLGDGTSTQRLNPVMVADALGYAIGGVAALMNNPSVLISIPADVTPPVITAAASITVTAVDNLGLPASDSTVTVFLNAATALDNVDGTVAVTNNAPITFPLGSTTVTFSATDAAGNTGTATATVTVTVLDSDNDGVADWNDAFPNDPAASLDSDNDGYPDVWNANATGAQITASGLMVDAFPNDATRWNANIGPGTGGTVADFNGDGNADVLLRNSTDGRWYFYPMNGPAVMTGKGLIAMSTDLAWRVKGQADFNADGKTDVLLRHATTGQWYLYLLNGSNILAGSGYINMTASLTWQAQSIADYNGDGRADVLLRNTTDNRWGMYLLDGTSILQGSLVSSMSTDAGWALP